MSLTTVMQNKEVRKKFNETLIYPKIRRTLELKAPPLTRNYSVVGTAFDYLIRFRLEAINQNIHKTSWIAKDSIYKIQETKVKDNGNLLKSIIEQAENEHDIYLKSKQLTEPLLAVCLKLAMFDIFYRSGVLLDFERVENKDIEDLRNIYEIMDQSTWETKKRCVLNPSFGKASAMVGGADADVILGDTLIEIKTVQKFDSSKEYINQLIGYYLLNRIDKAKCTGAKIEKIGIYFSRYASLQVFNIGDVLRPNDERILIECLIENHEKEASQYIESSKTIDSHLAGIPMQSIPDIKPFENYVIPYIENREIEMYFEFYEDVVIAYKTNGKNAFEESLSESIERFMNHYGNGNVQTISFGAFMSRIKKNDRFK